MSESDGIQRMSGLPSSDEKRREATPFGQKARYLIRDNYSTDGSHLARVAATRGIDVLRTPVRAPHATAICERLLGSVHRARLDHGLVVHDRHRGRVLREDVDDDNQARPHQGINQTIPAAAEAPARSGQGGRQILSVPIVGGLHHDDRLVA